MAKIATLAIDNITGYFDMAIREQQPAITEDGTTKGEWGLQWNLLMGRWTQMVSLVNDICTQHGVRVVMVGHLVPGFIGKGDDRKMIGWRVDVPGSGADPVLVAFDEVYHLQSMPNATGAAPPRRLFTQPHTIEGYPFRAKSRLGVGANGPLMNPDWDKLVKGLDPAPDRFLLVGAPGEGKTTFIGTMPKPLVILDMMGGTQRVAKLEGVHIVKPATVREVFKALLQVRNKPEVG